jgi:hypothetical protein
MLRAALLALVVLALAEPGSAFRPATLPHADAASVPTGLPSHLGIGLAASPSDIATGGWLPASGIPWDYAYQYLSGGVNTGAGWETWNSNGQFPLYYAQSAAASHYIPVFSYYELRQSTTTCSGCGEAQVDLSNLNNASLMASYFQNFALLMQRLGSGSYGGISGFGQTAIVHVEPDLSAYAEQAVLNNSANCYGYCTGQGNNPAALKAAVASSGYAAVAGYPNTYQGFNWALLHLRDLYAPNVLLAFHVSNWATMIDIGSDTSTSLDVAALGQEAGSFAAQAGISGVPTGTSSYNLIFNDVLDRDAAYYKYVYGDPSRWWDSLNVTFPNFHRWESYIQAISGATGRSVIVWQIPEGNQYFDTENNTTGHYQDNRVAYFFGHLGELVQAGVIGLLFGAGNAGSTVNTDAMHDGITNPPSFCTGDGLSSGQICNNHTSTVSDDDGGYLRLEGQQYYAGVYPLGGPTPTNTPTATVTPTPDVSPSATATASVTPIPLAVSVTSASAVPGTVSVPGNEKLTATIETNETLNGAIVDFEVYNAGGSKVYQSYQSPVNFVANQPQSFQATWSVPASEAAGTYTFKLGVFGAGWSPLYVWDNAAATFVVSTATATSTPTGTTTPVRPTATATHTPVPPASPGTATHTPVPTRTLTPTGAGTQTPVLPTGTATNTPVPPTPSVTQTPKVPTGTATHTPVPTRTVTPTGAVTQTPVPPTGTATNTQVPPTPTMTQTPGAPTGTATHTPVPPSSPGTATHTPVPTRTATP